MNFRFLKISNLLLFLTLSLSLADFCSAADEPATDSLLNLQIPIFDYAQSAGLPEYIANIFTYAMIILVPLAIIMVVWGGIQWVGAAGNSQKIGAAKKQISSAILGLILGLLTYTLLSYVGITQLYMPGLQKIKAIPLTAEELSFFVYDYESSDNSGTAGSVGTDGSGGGPIRADDIICPNDNCCDQNASGSMQAITSSTGITGCKASDCRLREQTLRQFKIAAQTAAAKGCSFEVTSAFRSLAAQTQLWNAYQAGTGNAAARPDPTCKKAPHQTGGAVDLAIKCGSKTCRPDAGEGSPNCANPELKKIMEDIMFSANFTRFSGEHWHFEYGTTRWQQSAGKAY